MKDRIQQPLDYAELRRAASAARSEYIAGAVARAFSRKGGR